MSGRSNIAAILIILIPLLISAKCQFENKNNSINSNQYVKSVSFDLDKGRPLSMQKQKILIKTSFYLRNSKLPEIKLPIVGFSPKNKNNIYGSFTIHSNGIDDSNPYHEIVLDLDLRKIFHEVERVDVKEVKLPNGKILSFNEHIVESGKMVLLKIEGIQSQVYLYAGQNEVLAGFSFGIKELDFIGELVGKTESCPEFQFGDILGIAGIYTGMSKGQNGLMMIVNLSHVISPQTLRSNTRGRDIASIQTSPKFEYENSDAENLRHSFAEPPRISTNKLYQVRKSFYQLIHRKSKLHLIEETRNDQ